MSIAIFTEPEVTADIGIMHLTLSVQIVCSLEQRLLWLWRPMQEWQSRPHRSHLCFDSGLLAIVSFLRARFSATAADNFSSPVCSCFGACFSRWCGRLRDLPSLYWCSGPSYLSCTHLYTSVAADRRLSAQRQALRRGCLLGCGHPLYGERGLASAADVVLAECSWRTFQREIGRPCWSFCLAKMSPICVGDFWGGRCWAFSPEGGTWSMSRCHITRYLVHRRYTRPFLAS